MKFYLLFFLFSFFSFYEGEKLKVYMVSGEALWSSESGESKALTGGDEIADGIVQLKKGKILLFNKEGKNFLIDKAGNYNFDELVAKIRREEEEISSAFFKHTWKMMNKKKEKPEDMKMVAGGVVGRGSKFSILTPGDSSIVFNSIVHVKWQHGNAPFEVQAYDQNENLILSETTNEVNYLLDLNSTAFPDNVALITIKDKLNNYTDYVSIHLYRH